MDFTELPIWCNYPLSQLKNNISMVRFLKNMKCVTTWRIMTLDQNTEKLNAYAFVYFTAYLYII